MKDYKPPFTWFGGKSPVAEIVWDAMGDVDNYVEPFFGSGAVLFLRPGGAGKVETVNDADGFVSNFWRALKSNPDAVADHADWPVNEADLHARHVWLLGQRERITERLMGDADFYDAKAAGWWVWGLNCWIAGGWCTGKGPWSVNEKGELALGNTGHGVRRTRPQLRTSGHGVNRKLPHLGDTGKSDATETIGLRRAWLRSYLGEISERLARVRVCCGDWSRVCGPCVTFIHGTTGVFLDPPYADSAKRTGDIYAVDCQKVAHAVREWAIEQGKNPLMRIVLAGYEGEHFMPPDWRMVAWKAHGGYGLSNTDEDGFGRKNAEKERIWMSPHCLTDETNAPLFAGVKE